MEGPSVHRVADELADFAGQTIEHVGGNADQPLDALAGGTIQRVRAVKKRLFLDVDPLHVVIHFLMYGSYRVNERRDLDERLALECDRDSLYLPQRESPAVHGGRESRALSPSFPRSYARRGRTESQQLGKSGGGLAFLRQQKREPARVRLRCEAQSGGWHRPHGPSEYPSIPRLSRGPTARVQTGVPERGMLSPLVSARSTPSAWKPRRLRRGGCHVYSCSVKVLEAGDEELAGYDRPVEDVLAAEFDADRAVETMLGDGRPVADVLLDQSVFGGVGTVVKNEVLWEVGVHPLTPGSALDRETAEALTDEAVRWTEDWYRTKRDGGDLGRQVYRGAECPPCGTDLERRELGADDRITYWCANCQRQ